METSIKLHSITRRWIMNVMIIDFLVVLICEVFMGVFLFNYYRNMVADAATEYVRDINVLSLSDEEGFPSAARGYAQKFSYRDKIEVQIFDKNDNMLVTTNGFASTGIAKVATDYSGEIPEGFDVIELPKCKYMMFQGEPFEEENFGEAIEAVWEAIKKYNPEVIGYTWDEENPRIQLEPIGTRGYIELLAVKSV